MSFEQCGDCPLVEQDNLGSINKVVEVIGEKLALDAEIYAVMLERPRRIYIEDQEYLGQAYADEHDQVPRRHAEAVAYGNLALVWSTSLAKVEAGVNEIDCSDVAGICPRRVAAFSAVVRLHNEDILGMQQPDE